MNKSRIKLISVILGVVLTVSVAVTQVADAYSAAEVARRVEVMTIGKEFDLTRVLVKYRDTDIEFADGNVMSVEGKVIAQVKGVDANKELAFGSVSEVDGVINAEGIKNVQNLLTELLLDPNVEYAEPNYFGHIMDWTDSGITSTPDDYNIPNHWYYTAGKVPEMWDDQSCATGGVDCGGDNTVIVAVIDTGLAFESYDDTGEYGYTDQVWDNGNYTYGPGEIGIDGGKLFSAVGVDYNIASGFNIWVNSGETPNDGKDNDCNGVVDDYNGFDPFSFYDYASVNWYYPDTNTQDFCSGSTPNDYSGATYLEYRKMGHPIDTYGHGSYVTGLISGVVDNTASSVSPAHNVKIMPIAANITFVNGFYSTEVISGIYYATEHGADVINMSLGGFSYSVSIQDAITYAYNNDVVVVAASGNENSSTVSYPAAFDNVIAVGAVNSDNTRSSYSNYGDALDVVAYVGDTGGPGGSTWQETLSCMSCDSTSTFDTTSVQFGNSTSYASPQVAAIAAIIKSNNPTAVASEVILGISNLAVDINTADWDIYTGHGVIDFEAANLFDIENIYITRYYYPAYAHNGTSHLGEIKIANPLNATNIVNVRVKMNGITTGTYALDPGDRISHNSMLAGQAVEIASDQPVYTTQKATVNGSLNEFTGISSDDLDTTFYYPAYAHNGTSHEGAIKVGNPTTGASTSNVTIKMNGVIVGTYILAPGDRISHNSMLAGQAVEVISDQPIYTTQKATVNGSLNEFTGIAASSLDTTYYYPAYANNGVSVKGDIKVANPSNASGTANVTIKMNGVIVGAYSIVPGDRVSHHSMLAGQAVEVISDQPVYTTQKATVNGSLNEFTGISASSLDTIYYYPAYAHNGAAVTGYIKVANPSDALNTANVTIKMNGTTVGTYALAPGDRISHSSMLAGQAVEVVSDQPIYTTQKATVNGSLNEFAGIGDSSL